jgi:hypothetical protein
MNILGDRNSNFDLSDLEWTWFRDRILAPQIIGPLTRLYPGWPGYEEAIQVMNEDWGVLIILDACRADVFEEIVGTGQFDEYRRVVSLGSHSSEWVRRSFGNDSFGDTVYVSANPHTNLLAHDSFHDIIELWDTHYDEELGTTPPEAVAEAAIKANKKYSDKRFIVHFMQPHGPLIGSDDPNPNRSDEAYWQAYGETLEYVMPHAMTVASCLQGRAVLTADHGQINYGGIFQMLGLKSHKPRLRLPGLVEVPWAVLSGDRRVVTSGDTSAGVRDNVTDRLRDLGYRI